AIGGTSIGSLIAAQYAAGQSPAEIIEGQRRTLVRRPPQYNFTLPIVSLVSGSRFTGLLRELFGELRIEDLCLPFFCVSSNLSRAEVMIHESGPVWSSVRASGTLPGVGPPNPYHGDLLVDGGVLNNLPIDIMRDRHSGTVLAVDVV